MSTTTTRSKRTLALFLAFVMLFSMLPLNVFAEELNDEDEGKESVEEIVEEGVDKQEENEDKEKTETEDPAEDPDKGEGEDKVDEVDEVKVDEGVIEEGKEPDEVVTDEAGSEMAEATVMMLNATQPVAKIGDAEYATLNEAIGEAEAGAVVLITTAGTYTLPNIPKNITIQGAEGAEVVFNCVGSGSICSIPNGATFENVTFNMGQNTYHGFQHAGTINMVDCVLNGLFFSYGDMNFTNCTFNQQKAEYLMWLYGMNVTFTGCTFNGYGKYFNVYNEGTTPYSITATNCTATNASDSKKAVFNVKDWCVNGNQLNTSVSVTNCTVDDASKYPTANSVWDNGNGTTGVALSSFVQVDDVKTVLDEGKAHGITIIVDSTEVYKNGAKVEAKKLPVATVTEIPKDQIKEAVDQFSNGGVPVCDFSNGLSLNSLYQTYPDCLYVFEADQTDMDNAYDDWYTDFVVSFDKDVAKDSMGLGGYYASFGAALGFLAPQMVPANYKVPLLNFMTNSPNWTYAMIRDQVQIFPCGAFNLSSANNNTTMTVQLRIFDPVVFDSSEKVMDDSLWKDGVNTHLIKEYKYKLTENGVIPYNNDEYVYAGTAEANANIPAGYFYVDGTVLTEATETDGAVSQATAYFKAPAPAVEVEVEIDETKGITKDIAEAINANTAVKAEDATNVADVQGVEKLVIVAKSVEGTKTTFTVEPKDVDDKKVSSPAQPITFRLPYVGSSDKVKLYHESDFIGYAEVKGTEGSRYVEVTSGTFSDFSYEDLPEGTVAAIGEDTYTTLADAIADLNDKDDVLVLMKEDAWPVATPVYYNGGYNGTLKAAVEKAYDDEYAANVIVCRPGADVGTMTHGHVAASLTIYGNGAYVSGGEHDFEIDTYKGKGGPAGSELTGDVTLNVYKLNGAAAWGQRNSEYVVTLNFYDCQNMQRVYFSTAKGTINVNVDKCSFDGTQGSSTNTSIKTDSKGTWKISNTSFKDVAVAIAVTNENGEADVTINNCTFTDVATKTNAADNSASDYASAVRVLGRSETTFKADGLTFNYSEGSEKNIADMVFGEVCPDKAATETVSYEVKNTAAEVKTVKAHEKVESIEDISEVKTVAATEILEENNAAAPAYVAQITKNGETAGYDSLNAAILAAETGDVVEILVADTYTLPNIPKNITIKGTVDGVVFDCVGSGSICSVPNGVTFENVTFKFGKDGSKPYHGFQHAGTINMNDCTLNGLLFSYSDMNFTGCTFNAPGTVESGISDVDYSMWLYAGNISFDDCTFNGAGKFFNVYNEGNGAWDVSVKDCVAISSTSKKAVFNVKETCVNGANLKYDVDFSGTNVAVGAFPASSNGESLTVLNSFVQVDDKRVGGTDDGGDITIKAEEGAKLAEIESVQDYEAAVADGKAALEKLINDNINSEAKFDYETPAAKTAVAKIGTTEYATLKDALDAAVAATAPVEIVILDDIDEEVTSTYRFQTNVTITADKAVTVDCGDKANGELFNAVNTTLTIGENVTLTDIFRIGPKETNGKIVIDGTVKAQYLAINGNPDDLTGYSEAVINGKFIGIGEAALRTENNSKLTVNGTGTNEAQIVGAYVSASGSKAVEFNFNDAAVQFSTFFATAGVDFDMTLTNSKVTVAGGDFPSIEISDTLTMDSTSELTLPTNGKFVVSEDATVKLAPGAKITANSITNNGTIEADMKDVTIDDQILLVDFTGTKELTIADYGSVTFINNSAQLSPVVENSDLYAKFAPVATVKVGDADAVGYATINGALAAAAAVETGDVTVTILDDVDEHIEARYTFKTNVTITADKAVTVDFDNIGDTSKGLDVTNSKNLTVTANVTIKGLNFIGLRHAQGGTVDLYGKLYINYLRAGTDKRDERSSLTLHTGAEIYEQSTGSCPLMIGGPVDVLIEGTQDSHTLVQFESAGDKTLTFKDATFKLSAGMDAADGDDSPANSTVTVTLNNSNVTSEHQFKINNGNYKGGTLNLTNNSTLTLVNNCATTFQSTDVINIDLTSKIVVNGTNATFNNAGKIVVDLKDATEASYTIVDFNGKGTPVYGTYEAVNAPEGYKLVVENNDLVAKKMAPVAKIGETKYYALDEAFEAVNEQTGDNVIITILDDITEELANADGYTFYKNVTLTAENPVTVDLVNNQVGNSVLVVSDGYTLTIAKDVTIKNVCQLYSGYNYKDTTITKDTNVDIYGNVESYQLWVYGKNAKGIMNIKPGASVKLNNEMLKMRYNAVLNIEGELAEGAAATADLTTTAKSVSGGYYWGDYSGDKEVNVKNAYADLGRFTNTAGKTGDAAKQNFTGNMKVELDNAIAKISTFNTGADAASSVVTLKNGSRLIITETMTVNAKETVNVEIGSKITAKGLTNVGSIVVDMTDADNTSDYTIIDYTGSGTPDYGTYAFAEGTGEGYELVVDENNDLVAKKLTPVAQIGETTFYSFDEALEAAEEGETITLLSDITATFPGATYNNDSVWSIEKSITIDGNSKTITCDAENWKQVDSKITGNLFSIGKEAQAETRMAVEVTVTNLTVVGNSLMKSGFSVISENGNVAKATFDNVQISNCGACGIVANAAKVTVKGDNTKIESCGWDGINADNGSAACGLSADLTVEAGDICSVKGENGKVTITGTAKVGEVISEGNGDVTVVNGTIGSLSKTGDAAKLEVTGGTFSVDPTAYCAEGYTATKDEEKNVWTVKLADKPVIIDEDDPDVKPLTDDQADLINTFIQKFTDISGVALNVTEIVEGTDKTGLGLLLNKAKEMGDEDFKKALDNPTELSIKIQVTVTPSSYKPEGESKNEGTIKFNLVPMATVTANGQTVENVPVTNDMLKQDQDIVVTVFTGFMPKQVIHSKDDKVVEVFTETDEPTFAFDSTSGVCTMTIHQFSDLLVVQDQVAQIGDDLYPTLEAAVAAAQDGETVKLLDNVDVTASIEVSGKAITLDLNGKTVEYKGTTINNTGVFVVHNGAALTVNDGDNSTNTGKIISGEKCYSAIALTKNGDEATNPAKVTVNGGQIIGDYYGIVTNGSRDNTEITVNGGTVKGTHEEDNFGIFNPNNGSVTVTGGTIEGYSAAIEIRGGSLNVTGGTLTATAETYSVTASGSGSTTVGAAVAVAQHNTKKELSVSITGGTLSGVNAVSVANPQNNDTSNVSVTLDAATYNGALAFSADGNATVTKTDEAVPTAPTGYKWDDTGKLVKCEYVAQIGEEPNVQKFETLAEAVAVAESGDTVTLLADCSGNGIQINKNITIDLGGKTYTVNGNLTGSSDTKTQAFQLLVGNNVKFKNGTITTTADAGAKMLIQNYSNLTLDGVTLDGTNLTGTKYTLSNNAGDIKLTGETKIIAAEGGVAYDLYDWASGSTKYTGVSMTIGENVVISGKVEVGGDRDTLNIQVTAPADKMPEAPEGYLWDDTGKLVKAVATVTSGTETTGYATLAEAVAAAESGDTVTLLDSCSGSGIVINKNITIDFGNNTYTVGKPGVGSKNTETIGFQILQGNSVEFKNGKIDIATDNPTQVNDESGKPIKMLIQNYANLTLTGMTLDANNINRKNNAGDAYTGARYAMSNNSGSVVIENTTITVASGDVAFDTCKSGTYAVPTVEVKGNSVINGNVELGGGNLTLTAGTLNGELVDGGIGSGNVTKATDFTAEAPTGYKWDDSGKLVKCEYVAQIGTGDTAKKFETLAEAVAAAQTDDEIVLLADAAVSGRLDIGGKSFSIDLSEKTLDLPDKASLNISSSSNVVIKNGKVTGTGDGNKTSNTWNEKIEVWGGATLEFNAVEMSFAGVPCPDTIKNDGGTLKIIGSTVTFDGCKHGIFVNGTTDITNSTLTHKNVGNMFDGNNPAANKLTITNSTLTATENVSGKLLANVDAKVIDSDLTVSSSDIALHTASVELVKDTKETGSTLTITHAGSHGFTNGQLIVNEGCTVDVSDVQFLGLNVKGNSVFKNGSTVNVSDCGKVGTDHYNNVAISVVDEGNSLTIEKGANVTVDGIVSSGWLTDGMPSTINIADGKFTQVFQREEATPCYISLTGGLYKNRPDDDFAAEGYAVFANTDEATSAEYPFTVKKAVAQIDEVKYSTLDEALVAAAAVKDRSNVTIKLLCDFAEVLPQRQDEQGHWGYIFENVNVTITADSAVVADLTDTNYHAALIAGDDAVVTIEENVTLKNCGSVGSYHYVEEHTNAKGNGVFNINGTVTPVHAHLDGITMNIGTTGKFGWADGSSSSMFPMEENGTLNITGTLSEVPAEAPADYQFKAMCFGTSLAGTKNIALNNTAASFTQFGFANGDVNTVNLTVSHSFLNNRDGMTVNGTTTLTADSKIVVTGGNASFGAITIDMTGATADSYTVIEVKTASKTGTYGEVTLINNPNCYAAKVVDNDLVLTKSVAKIGTTGYATLAEAIAAAQDGQTVTLLADCSGDGIVINKNITIDLGGKTYTVNANTVGSTGTKTNGFQLLKGNAITFRNGTIDTVEEANTKHLIQNYSNLTLENVKLDGTKLHAADGKTLYTLSNCNGNIVFDGETKITASPVEGSFAYDLYSWTSYPDGIKLTIGDEVEIDGDVEIDGNTETLNIQVSAPASKLPEAPDGYKWVDGENGFKVLAEKVLPELKSDIGEKRFIAGGSDWVEFTFSTVANDYAGVNVIGGSDFGSAYADALSGLEYKQGDQWIDMLGQDFGGAGFPLTDTTSEFRAKFKDGKDGEYSFTAFVKTVEDNEELCTLDVPFTVHKATKTITIKNIETTDAPDFVPAKNVVYCHPDQGVQMSVTIDPTDANPPLVWGVMNMVSGSQPLATIDKDGILRPTGLGNGFVVVTVIANDGSHATDYGVESGFAPEDSDVYDRIGIEIRVPVEDISVNATGFNGGEKIAIVDCDEVKFTGSVAPTYAYNVEYNKAIIDLEESTPNPVVNWTVYEKNTNDDGWTPVGNGSSNDANYIAFYKPTKSGTYKFEVVDADNKVKTGSDKGATTSYEFTAVRVEATAISATDVELKVGATGSSTVTVTDPTPCSAPNYTWTSKDTSIATVDSYGIIKGVKVGETTVEVVANNDPSVKATFKVTVEAADFTFSITGVTPMYVGGTQKLVANISSTDEELEKEAIADLKWSSDKTDVATVDENTGEVKAEAAGKVTITATAKGKTATFEIVVENHTLAITNEVTTIKVGEELALTATYDGVEPEDVVTWSFAEETSYAEVSGSTLTGKAAGTVKVKATYKGETATKDFTIQPNTIMINNDPKSVAAGSTLTLTATVNGADPAEATDITWSVEEGKSSVAAISGTNTLMGIGGGTVKVTATYKTGETATADFTVTAVSNNVAVNTSTNVTYASLTAALAAAKSGQTVQPLKNIGTEGGATKEDFIVVSSGVTLDLNGYSISGATMIYVTGTIKDSQTTAATKGTVSASGYLFPDGGADEQFYLPVFNGTGYQFFNLYVGCKLTKGEKDTLEFALSMKQGETVEACSSIKQGYSTGRIKAVVTVTWTNGDTTGEQRFTFSDDFTKKFAAAPKNWHFAVSFSELEEYENVKVQACFTAYNEADKAISSVCSSVLSY